MDNELITLLKSYLKNNVIGMAGINTRGNRQVLTYFTGVSSENPSGDTNNLQKIDYYDSDRLIVTESYVYNVDNLIIEITTT